MTLAVIIDTKLCENKTLSKESVDFSGRQAEIDAQLAAQLAAERVSREMKQAALGLNRNRRLLSRRRWKLNKGSACWLILNVSVRPGQRDLFLQKLNTEQAKYGDLDDQGIPCESLQKSLIIELDARKNSLLQETRTLAQ